MSIRTKIDSNTTGLAFAEEQSLGTLPGSPTWYELEPNKYSNFGGEIKTVARDPINPTRQRKKGTTVDLDASGGFTTDITQSNLQTILQGFFFASLRTKAELSVATVTGSSSDEYNPPSGGTAFKVGDLLFAKGFDDAGNNGLKRVKATVTGTAVPVTTDLTTAATQSGTISRVGIQAGTTDISVDVSGTYPKLISVVKDFTEIGLIPGEWIFVGGDQTAEKFAITANNGFARVFSVATNAIEVDKTTGTWATDAGTGKTIRIFCGRCLKNEAGDLIVRRTYQLERKLGGPDTSLDPAVQSEYLVGAVPNEATFDFAKADKLTVDLSFVGTDVEQRDQTTGVKSGTRVAVTEATPFNTSSDFSRIKLSEVGIGPPSPLFAFVQDMKLTVNNHDAANKALGVLGAFEVSSGIFEVGGSLTAYFADVAAVTSVRDNTDITLDVIMAKENAGIAIDMPLVTLGDGRPDVKKDEPIYIPLTLAAATGAKIDPSLNHTLFLVFFDYLPDAAM